jgi:hypothetical protein
VVPFKRDLYEAVLAAFQPHLGPQIGIEAVPQADRPR